MLLKFKGINLGDQPGHECQQCCVSCVSHSAVPHSSRDVRCTLVVLPELLAPQLLCCSP